MNEKKAPQVTKPMPESPIPDAVHGDNDVDAVCKIVKAALLEVRNLPLYPECMSSNLMSVIEVLKKMYLLSQIRK